MPSVQHQADWELSYWQQGANAARSGHQPISEQEMLDEKRLTSDQVRAWLNGYEFAVEQMAKEQNIWWVNANRITRIGIHKNYRRIVFSDSGLE